MLRKIIFLFVTLFFAGSAFAQGGGPLMGSSSEPIEITADSLTVKRLNEIAVFSGNVVAIQGKVNLRSDVMTVYYRGKNEAVNGQNTISKIDVDGRVFLTTPEETAQGDAGVYDVDNKKITLTGAVVLTKKENVIKGNHLVYDLVTGRSDLQSKKIVDSTGKAKGERVRGLFVPEQKPANSENKQ